MRENTKWIMLVTALAFVALMVFEWGMDASGRSAMGVGQIGSVNGTPVMYDDYMATYRNLYDRYQEQQERPISSQQNTEIEDQAFDEVVNQILIQQELSRRGIRVTDEEIQQAARFSPPPEIRQNQGFQTDGRFDPQKYRDFLATSADNQFLLQLEQYYRNVIPRSKLMRQVTSGIYPSDAELWESWKLRNEQVRAVFGALSPAQRIPDSEVSVTDAEIEGYYEEQREEFAVPARATVKVAHLTKAPEAADTAAALERAREIRREILDGADFGEVAQRESSDEGTVQDGGDLGTFGRGQMVPAFEEAAFAASAGEITEPVRTRFGFHVIQVRERQADSVTAGHILIPIERTDDSELQLLTEADSLEAMAETMTLEEAASNLGIDARQVQINENFPLASGVGRMAEGADWVFEEAAPGDVSPVFENDQAFYALELVSSQPAGYRSLEEAREEIRQTLTVRKKMDRALSIGGEVVRAARQAGSLRTVADTFDLSLREPGAFNRLGFVPGVGRANAAIGTAFGLAEGEIGGPVETDDNVFVVEVLERIPADSAAWEAQKEQQRQQRIAQTQQQRLQSWMAGLRENADIVDRREEVLLGPDEQQQSPMGMPMGF